MQNIFKTLRAMIDPYESYTPSPSLPTFNFCSVQQAKAITPKKEIVHIPTGYETKLTSIGVSLQKTESIKDGIEVELLHLQDAKLQGCELDAILEKYPSVNKNAIFISKRCWAKGLTIPQTIIELKKNGCEYSRTYIAFFRKVFDEFKTKIGEGVKDTPLPRLSN